MTKDNNLLGSFDLNDIPPARQGHPQIEVTFEIDVNGILSVTARARNLFFGIANEKTVIMTNDHNRLSKQEIEWMVNDARRLEDEDRKVRERTDAYSELESYVYFLKNQVGEEEKWGGVMSASEKETIEKALEGTTEWLEFHPEADTEEFKAKKELEEVVHPIIDNEDTGGLPSELSGKTEL